MSSNTSLKITKVQLPSEQDQHEVINEVKSSIVPLRGMKPSDEPEPSCDPFSSLYAKRGKKRPGEVFNRGYFTSTLTSPLTNLQILRKVKEA